MAYENISWNLTIQASEALTDIAAGTGELNKAVSNLGKIAADGQSALGLLKYGADDGGHVALGFAGQMKYVAGEAITAAAQLSVTGSGYLRVATSGDTVVGRALTVSVASGAVGTALFDFSTPHKLLVGSGHVSNNGLFGFTAQADLTVAGAANKIVNAHSGDFCADGNDASGVLITGTVSGSTSFMRFTDAVDVVAGGVLLAGQSLTAAASGFCTAGNSGDLILGRALEASAAGNSGSTFKANFNFGAPHFATNCFDVQYGV